MGMTTLEWAGSRRCLSSGKQHPLASIHSPNRSGVGLGCEGLHRRRTKRSRQTRTTQKCLLLAVQPVDVLLDAHRAALHPLSSANALHESVAGLVPCEGVPQCRQYKSRWCGERGLPSCGALHELVEMGSLPHGCLACSM